MSFLDTWALDFRLGLDYIGTAVGSKAAADDLQALIVANQAAQGNVTLRDDSRDVFTLDGKQYYVDTGEPVPLGQAEKPTLSLVDQAKAALGFGAPSQPDTFDKIGSILMWAAILGSAMLVFWVAIQIKIALR